MPAPARVEPCPLGQGAGAAAFWLGAACLMLFGSFLVPGGDRLLAQAGRDLDTQVIWWRQFAFGELARGHLALWIPHLFCGTPFFGYLQPGLLYPPNFLYLILPLVLAVNFSIVLHLFLGGWFTYLWASPWGRKPALLCAFMFMLGASLLLRLVPGHLLNLAAMPWTPLGLFALSGWRERRQAGWVLLGILAFGMQVLSGQVQIFYYGLLLTGATAIFSLPAKGRTRYLAGFAAMVAGGLLLGAVQLLAGWDASRESLRGVGMSLDVASQTPLEPERLVNLVLPGFFGDWRRYWGPGLYWEGALYASLTGFVLACFGWRKSADPRRHFFAGAFFFLGILALGKKGGLYLAFFHWMPLFNHFRGVAKLDFCMTLCLCALAALGLQKVLDEKESLAGLARVLAWFGFSLLGLAAVFAAAGFWKLPQHFSRYRAELPAMALSLLTGAVLLGFLWLLAWGSRRQPRLRMGFFWLALGELFCFAWGTRPSFSWEALNQKLEPLRQVYRQDPGDYRVLADSKNYALGTGGRDVWGYDTNIPSRYGRFMALAQSRATDSFLKDSDLAGAPKALGLVGLRYVFRDDGTRLVPLRLHLKEVPRAFLVDRWRVMDESQAIQKDLQPGFDPLKEASLESDPGISAEPGRLAGKARVQDLSSDRLELDVRVSKPALLVLDENYSAGWKATAGPADPQGHYQVLPADGFLRVVPLTTGEHHFFLQYRPAAFVWGQWISSASLLVYLAAAAFWGFRRRSREVAA
ncbi:MAG TPA: hypothetical protein VMU88_02580 [bacterium]|nr:hypothetical protein [bacterium]